MSSHGCTTREHRVKKGRVDHGTEQLDEIARINRSIAYQHGIQAWQTAFSLVRAEFVEQCDFKRRDILISLEGRVCLAST